MTTRRSFLRWLPVFLAFPLGGFVAELIAGPVDALVPAVLAGMIAGATLGTAQSWALGPGGPPARDWVLATAAGLATGLALGSAAVGYGTGLGDLVIQGGICGLVVGAAQALVLRGRAALVWAAAVTAVWALGWATSTSIGIDVERQWAVFGASGALLVTAATALLAATTARATS